MADRPILNPSNPAGAAKLINPPGNPPSTEPPIVNEASRIISPRESERKEKFEK